jgi:hypothetical protein
MRAMATVVLVIPQVMDLRMSQVGAELAVAMKPLRKPPITQNLPALKVHQIRRETMGTMMMMRQEGHALSLLALLAPLILLGPQVF